MRRSKVYFAVIISLLLVSVSANAAELFVSLSGNDANPGTLAAPFRTVDKAAFVAAPGDIVSVRAGTYVGRVKIYGSKGTASARIVYRAYPGEKVIFDGTGVASDKAVVSLNDTEYVDFSGFEVRNAPHIGIALWYARQTRVLNNVVHDTVRNGIYVGADTTGVVSDITISGNTVYHTVLENQYHNMSDAGWAGAVVIAYCERAVITRNRIYQNDGEGIIYLRSNHARIAGNEISDSFSANLYIDNARFVVADGNLIYSTGNSRYFRDGKPSPGIGIANETNTIMNPSSDNTFTNNVVIGTRWGFFYGNFETGGGLRNTKVVNNTFYRTVDEIIRIDDDAHSNNVVENNIFDQTGSPAPRYAGTSGTTYRNNLWYGGSAGPAAGAGDVYGDPLFVNRGTFVAADYRLRAGSPAISAGANTLSLVPTDHTGSARSLPIDIGAHESAVAGDVNAPSVPDGLRATVGGTASVTLVWTASTDNVGVTGYVVLRNGAVVATIGAVTTWTDTNLAERTIYSYQVQAIDAAGNRSAASAAMPVAWSSSAADVDGEAPTAPVQLRGSASSTTIIDLDWAAATDNVRVVTYRIYRDGSRIASITGTRYTDTTVAAGTSYTYHVVAVDEAGNRSVASNSVQVTSKSAGRARAARH
jgi:chitodextrinase